MQILKSVSKHLTKYILKENIHLCGIVDILKSRVAGNHCSKIGEGTQTVEPALGVIHFRAFKALDYCLLRDTKQNKITSLVSSSKAFYFSLFFVCKICYLILTDLSKNTVDDALDKDQRPCKSKPLPAIITSSAARVRQTRLKNRLPHSN